jgi:1-acyl-sn-glycerol-3-phosphate acyltransferase
LLYQLIKIIVRLALKIFCPELVVNHGRLLKLQGPVLIAANHPNSFFDAILIGALFTRPVHFLARGDAFRKAWHRKLFGLLNMIPVYRLSDGKENLGLNETAFQRSKEILSQGGLVLIFIEGICVNKHELQPFKKGAARIASESKSLTGFKVLPIGIAYNSFHRFGKRVRIAIAEPVPVGSLFIFEEEAKNIRHFNEVLFDLIGKNITMPPAGRSLSKAKKKLLFVPAIMGVVLHIGFYGLIKNAVKKKTHGTVFYDSVLFGALLLIYQLVLLLVCGILLFLNVPAFVPCLIFILFPLLAYSAVVYRDGRN